MEPNPQQGWLTAYFVTNSASKQKPNRLHCLCSQQDSLFIRLSTFSDLQNKKTEAIIILPLVVRFFIDLETEAVWPAERKEVIVVVWWANRYFLFLLLLNRKFIHKTNTHRPYFVCVCVGAASKGHQSISLYDLSIFLFTFSISYELLWFLVFIKEKVNTKTFCLWLTWNLFYLIASFWFFIHVCLLCL